MLMARKYLLEVTMQQKRYAKHYQKQKKVIHAFMF
jgi:hypothetical protein